MRLDKFLKVSRIIKRRTLAKEVCDAGSIILNGKVAKAGSEVKEGDILEINFGSKSGSYKIIKITERASVQEASSLYIELNGNK